MSSFGHNASSIRSVFFSSSSLIGGHSKWCLLNNTVYNIYAINKMWWNYHPNHSNIVSRFVCCLFVKYTLCSILLIDWFMSSMIWSTFDEARLKPVIFYNFSIKSSNPLHSIKKWKEKKISLPKATNGIMTSISWFRNDIGERKKEYQTRAYVRTWLCQVLNFRSQYIIHFYCDWYNPIVEFLFDLN